MHVISLGMPLKTLISLGKNPEYFPNQLRNTLHQPTPPLPQQSSLHPLMDARLDGVVDFNEALKALAEVIQWAEASLQTKEEE